MKKLFTFILLLCGVSVHSQSGWFVQPVDITSFMWEVEMITKNVAYISADGGRVLKTTNGTTWNITPLPSATDLFSIDFPNASTGYTAGALGKIFKTTNSGTNWLPVNSPTTNSILSVRFLNESTGIIGGGTDNDGEVYRTTNGGVNWTEHGTGSAFPQIVHMFFSSANTGYAVGTHSLIMKTTNNGINWTRQESGLGNVTFFGVYFINDNTGYATTPFPGNILKTTNGGTNWNSNYSNIEHFTVSVFFTSPDTGYVTGAVGDKVMVMKTLNAGANWNLQTLNFGGHLNSINFIDANTGYIACDEGRLYKTTNGGTTVGIANNSELIPERFTLYQNYPNPFNPNTIISYQLSLPAGKAGMYNSVVVKVYDILGNEITTLVNEKKPAGNYEVNFDGSDLPSGVYYYKLTVGELSDTKKMVLLK